jgi:uncharacterized protein (DUF4415 family)
MTRQNSRRLNLTPPSCVWQTAVRARVCKLRINIMLDAPIVEHFKALTGSRGYQKLINDSLRRRMETGPLEADLHRVIREELSH